MENKEKYKILINQKPYEVDNQFITGAQIKALAGSPANYGVWLKVNGPDGNSVYSEHLISPQSEQSKLTG